MNIFKALILSLALIFASGASYAAITHVAGDSVETASGTTHRITLPDPLTENDVVILTIAVDGRNVILDAGLTEIGTATENDTRPKVAYFVSDGTEGGTSIGGTTASGDAGAVGYSIWRGVDLTQIQDATLTTAQAVSGSIVSTSITTVTDGAVVMLVSAIQRHRVQTLDASLTTSFNRAGNVNGVGIAVGYETLATAGASGAYTNTLDTADEEWVALTIALRPATGPTVVTRYIDTDVVGGTGSGESLANAYADLDAAATDINSEFTDISAATGSDTQIIIIATGSADDPSDTVEFTTIGDYATENWIEIYGDSTEAVWDTANYTIRNVTDSGFKILEFDATTVAVKLHNIQVDVSQRSNSGTHFHGIGIGNSTTTAGRMDIYNVIMKTDGANTGAGELRAFYNTVGGADLYVDNFVCDTLTTSGSGDAMCFYSGASSPDIFATNGRIRDTDLAAGGGGDDDIQFVNVIFDNTPTTAAGSWDTASDWNGTDETDATSALPGSNNTYEASYAVVSETADAEDYHLSADNNDGAGPTDGTVGSFVRVLDFDGETRSGANSDLGPVEYLSSGSVAPAAEQHYYNMRINQ